MSQIYTTTIANLDHLGISNPATCGMISIASVENSCQAFDELGMSHMDAGETRYAKA